MLRFLIASPTNIGRLKNEREKTDFSDPPACAKRMNEKGEGGEIGEKRKRERKKTKGVGLSSVVRLENFSPNCKK